MVPCKKNYNDSQMGGKTQAWSAINLLMAVSAIGALKQRRN